MPTQREVMRQLWQKYAPDHDRIIREYAAFEMAGIAPRASNPFNISPGEYAKRLLADGVAKGWVNASAPARTVANRAPPIGAYNIPDSDTTVRMTLSSPDLGREEWAAALAR